MKKSLLALSAAAVVATPVALEAQQSRAISATERQQGAQAHGQMVEEFGGAYNAPQADYVRRIGQRIAVQSGLSNAQSDFTVTLLNSPVNNAFAIPGGYVYVTRQLMGLMNDEAELASVMGHEVAHVAARHSASRNRNQTFTGLGALLVGVLTGNQALAQLAQTGAQLYSLRYGRQQELQADDLGIQYLQRAGYDPRAAASMLASLASQTALDTRVAQRNVRSAPEWASTHPDPASRVLRATQMAARYPVAGGGVRNRDAFLNALNGTLYDDDPKQGIVDGQTFRHPDLRLTFTVPNGYAMSNGTDAVTISGSGGRAQFSGGRATASLEDYVGRVFQALAGNQGGAGPTPQVRRTRIAGFDSAVGSARANTQNGSVDVTVVAYQFAPDTVYHFLTITPAGSGAGQFASMFESVRRLTPQEAAAIRARKIQVVTATRTDTAETLSRRMAYGNFQQERFRTLNALRPQDRVVAGQRYKIVTY